MRECIEGAWPGIFSFVHFWGLLQRWPHSPRQDVKAVPCHRGSDSGLFP
jgi:hypothetical protein